MNLEPQTTFQISLLFSKYEHKYKKKQSNKLDGNI